MDQLIIRGSFKPISIKNNTKKTIYVAIKIWPYEAKNETWNFKYWYTLYPGENAHIFDTFNTIFYYYAETSGTNLFGQKSGIWGGNFYKNIDGVQYGFGKCTMYQFTSIAGEQGTFKYTLEFEK